MRETVALKADRLLVTGAVSVLEAGVGHVLAEVVGDHGTHTVEHDGRWTCDCPALTYCSHAIATARVFPVARQYGNPADFAKKTLGGNGDMSSPRRCIDSTC